MIGIGGCRIYCLFRPNLTANASEAAPRRLARARGLREVVEEPSAVDGRGVSYEMKEEEVLWRDEDRDSRPIGTLLLASLNAQH